MKKVLYVFSALAIAVLTACGPSADELAQKEKMRQDSLDAVQAARQDSLDAANAMEQARLDSTSAAEAMAAAQTAPAAKRSSAKPKAETPKPKEETKPSRDGLNQTGGSGTVSPRSGTNDAGNTDKKDGAKPDVKKRGGLNENPK